MRPEQATRYRTERDPLGEKRVPDDVLYGVQTLRALETFQISGLRMDQSLITAIAEIKKAAALAHLESGDLDEKIGKAIVDAAGEIIEGQWREDFVLDVFQAGAGTSYNMNANEVIANRALENWGAAAVTMKLSSQTITSTIKATSGVTAEPGRLSRALRDPV